MPKISAKTKELTIKDIITTKTCNSKYHSLRITVHNHYFMVRIYNKNKDMNEFVKSCDSKTKSVYGAYVANTNKSKKIGIIVLAFQTLTLPLIIHECSHAALDYHSHIFNNNTKHENLPITIGINNQEEFFCNLTSYLATEIIRYSMYSYRLLW